MPRRTHCLSAALVVAAALVGFSPAASAQDAITAPLITEPMPVEVDSGTLKISANHVSFASKDGSGNLDFFFSDDVPGGLVKYEFKNGQGDRYTVAMTGHGNGATTELGAY